MRTIMPRGRARRTKRIESEAARTGDPLAADAADRRRRDPAAALPRCRHACAPTARSTTSCAFRRSVRSRPAGCAMSNLPADAPLRMVPANLRRVLGLDASEKIRLAAFRPSVDAQSFRAMCTSVHCVRKLVPAPAPNPLTVLADQRTGQEQSWSQPEESDHVHKTLLAAAALAAMIDASRPCRASSRQGVA